MAPSNSKMLIERRFPVRLGQQVTGLEEAYRREKEAHWNPIADIPWELICVNDLSQQDRDDACLVWSRRLWTAYGYLSETPATLIRLCLELDRPISPKFFLTVRNTQEACHIDVMQKIAEAYGGYLPKPASPAYAKILSLDLSQRILHADTLADAFILAHCAIKVGAEAILYNLFRSSAKNKAIYSALNYIANDKTRHAMFGWAFTNDRFDAWTDADRLLVEAEIARVFREVILSGYLTPFYAPDGVAEKEKSAEERLAAAGLGGAGKTSQVKALNAYFAEVRERLADWSIDLPDFISS